MSVGPLLSCACLPWRVCGPQEAATATGGYLAGSKLCFADVSLFSGLTAVISGMMEGGRTRGSAAGVAVRIGCET